MPSSGVHGALVEKAPPRLRDTKPLFIEDVSVPEQTGGDWDSETLLEAAARTVTDPGSWFPALTSVRSVDMSACIVGTLLGTVVAALCVPATMKIGIFPGTSQITLIFSYAMFRSEFWAKRMKWFGLTVKGKSRYLLILQSCGSAPAGVAMGALVSLPLGLILERDYRDNHKSDFNVTSDHAEADSMTLTLAAFAVVACLAGSLTGAAWTNINMANELKKDYPAPEAHASASLINTFAQDTAPLADDGRPGENGAPPAGKQSRGSQMWFAPAFGAGVIIMTLTGVGKWLGFLPDATTFPIKDETFSPDVFKNKLVEVYSSLSNDTEAFKSLSDKIPSLGSVGGMELSVAVATLTAGASALMKSSKYTLAPESYGITLGVGGLLSMRTGVTMLVGSFMFVAIHYFMPRVMASQIASEGGDLKFDQFRDGVENALRWCPLENGTIFKWIAVTMIFVSTVFGVAEAMCSQGAATRKDMDRTPMSLRKPAWVNPFNVVCIVLGYAMTLLFLVPVMPSNATLLSKAVMCLVTFVADYVCNQVGGQQSLLLGGSNSPVSACLFIAVIALTFVKFLEVQEGQDGYTVEGAVNDYKVFGIWAVRLFTSIAYTNDAAQDYATTQILGDNIYIATRENLFSSLFASFLMPFIVWFFIGMMPQGAHLGSAEIGGYATSAADAQVTVHHGLLNGGIPIYSVSFSFALSVVGIAITLFGRQKPRHTDGRVRKALLFIAKDFNLQSLALGIYLGTHLGAGVFVGGFMVMLAGVFRGAGGGNRTKELYLVAVGCLTGNAVSVLIEVGYMLYSFVRGVESLEMNQVLPLFGRFEYDDSKGSWHAGWTGLEKSDTQWMSLVMMAIAGFAIFVSQLLGNEMDAAPPEFELQSDDEEQLDHEMRDDMAAEREMELKKWRAENGVAGDDDDLTSEWRQADEAASIAQDRHQALVKRTSHARANVMANHMRQGFQGRMSREQVDNRKKFYTLMWGAVAVFIAFTAVCYLWGTSAQGMQWSRWRKSEMQDVSSHSFTEKSAAVQYVDNFTSAVFREDPLVESS